MRPGHAHEPVGKAGVVVDGDQEPLQPFLKPQGGVFALERAACPVAECVKGGFRGQAVIRICQPLHARSGLIFSLILCQGQAVAQ